MTTLISKLSKDIKIHTAATGTIYLTYDEKIIRIGNHEPNYSMVKFRGKPDIKIYTHDIDGNEIANPYEVLEQVASFYGLNIPRELKSAITRSKKVKAAKQAAKQAAINKKEDELATRLESRNEFIAKVKEAISGKESLIEPIIAGANEYGSLGSNGDKRRKRKASYFKREFFALFGIEATFDDVQRALNH
jgi:hypothetical protein